MSTNFLKPLNISVDEIVSQITDKIASDPQFDNIRQSSVFTMLSQIFGSTTAMLLYYMERRSEECFFDTAKLQSSVISLSRQLGYSVQVPIPATAKMSVTIKGDFSSSVLIAGDVIQVPYHSVFSYGEFSYIIKDTLSYEINSDMANKMNLQGSSYSYTFETDYKGSDIVVIEGAIKEQVIDGSTNPLLGAKFQSYPIDDSTFSNIYGSEDYDVPITRVWVGQNKDKEYLVDRKTLINWTTIAAYSKDPTTTQNVCVIRSGLNNMEVQFGDAKFASLGASATDQGATTTYDNIFIQYLSTKGSKGNKTGLIGEKLNYTGKVYTPRGIDITSQVEFNFIYNPTGGADMETIDAIRMNAPEIYYSLDRLVTPRDYVAYLKSLTSPILIKNALAWGEQEECALQGITSNKKLFNVVFFTCLGQLYQTDVSPYYVKETITGLNTTVLDADFDVDDISIQSYMNVYVKQEAIAQIKDYSNSASYWDYKGRDNSNLQNLSPGAIYLDTTYGNLGSLDITYGSEICEPTITSTINIPIDMTGISSYTSPDPEAFNTEIASRITTAIRTIKDTRGLISTNSNKDQYAFPNITCYCTIDSGFKALGISATQTDKCYIANISGSLAFDLGLSAVPICNPTKLISTFTEPIAENIISVVNKLKERAQITVQNIYTTPIIQEFGLSGKVYISPLYDLVAIQTQINDGIYDYLNLNADFNVAIHKSNIVEIIESNKGVKYSECNFYPLYPIKSDGGLFSSDVPLIYNSWSSIYSFNFYLTFYLMENELNGINLITERKFYDIVKSYYDGTANYLINMGLLGFKDGAPLFAESLDFTKCIALYRKDYLKFIRGNLINTYGDIGEPIISNGISSYGYSLGSEIPKIKSYLTFQYK